MKSISRLTLVLAFAAMPLSAAWADGNSNVCKPSDGSTDTVLCTWPQDPSVNPLPDVTDCQDMLRVPTTSTDDCGNADFKACMEDKGFKCSENKV